MAGICNHTSVGMLVWKEGKLLLIERVRFPFGFAVPAGHVDGDENYEIAAKRELEEEVGLSTERLVLVGEGRKNNACRREGGSWHYWKLYKVEASGDLKPNADEAKQAKWLSLPEIKDLAEITEKYLNKSLSEDEWRKNPGLEPVMYEWFKILNII